MYLRSATRTLAIAGLAAVTAVAAGATEASAATPKAGVYYGSTQQNNSIAIKVERVSDKMIVRRVTVKGTAKFSYGQPPEEVSVSRLVLGGTVKNGRFHIPDTDIDLSGHFVTSSRVEGKFDIKTAFSDCETSDIWYQARRG
jgi:hypothetical protein